MRWTIPLTTLLLATFLAVPALAQESHEGMKDHGEKKGMHCPVGKMHGMHGMADMLEAHADQLNLTDEQLASLEDLDERMEAEKERHHEAMESIHEDAMQVLTPEQRDSVQEMMRSMHAARGEGHGMKRGHGEKGTHEMKSEKKKKKQYHDEDDEDEYR